MKYANINGIRIEPQPKMKALCFGCGKDVVSKCGKVKAWHWAHTSKRDCDHWWENEGPWHLGWKKNFPKEFEEIWMTDELSGEKHRADLRTPNGLVIELQNSNISIDEVQSRESFYKKMIWIVNAEKFKHQFQLGYPLPGTKSNFNKDIVFKNTAPHGRSSIDHAIWYHRSDVEPGYLVEHFGILQKPAIKNEILVCFENEYFAHWKNPREIWLSTEAPVYLDMGDDGIWRIVLDHPNTESQLVLKRIQKQTLIENIINGFSDL